MKRTETEVVLISVLLVLLPLVYLSGYGSYNIIRYFFFGTGTLVLGLFTIHKIIKNKWLVSSFFKSWYFYGLISYLVCFFLVSATSINPALSFWSTFQRTDGVFVVLFLSLFAFLIYSMVSMYGQETAKRLLASSVLGASAFSILVFLSPEGFSVLHWQWMIEARGGATIGNSSLAAAYVLWNLFFAAILFIKSGSLKKRTVWLSSFLILALSPLFLNWHVFLGKEKYAGLLSIIGSARGALLGIVFGSLVALGIYLILDRNRLKKYTGILIVSIVLITIVSGGVILLQKSSTLHQKFIENVGENRFIFWDSALKGFKESPILGTGPNTFNHAFHKFFDARMLLPQAGGEVLADRSHNIFIETLVNGGIVLLFALLFFLISIFWVLIKLGKNGRLLKYESALLSGALFGWLFQSLFVFDSISSLVMLFSVCGITYGSLIVKPELKKESRYYFSIKEKFIFVGFACIAVALFIFTIVLPFNKNKLMNDVFDTKLPQRINLWKKLPNISPMGDANDTVLLLNKVYQSYDSSKENLRNADDLKKKVILEELDTIIDYAFNLIDKNENYDLIIFTTKISYIRMYINNDTHTPLLDKNMELIDKAIQMSPTDPHPYWIKAQLEAAIGEYSQAKDSLEKAFLLEPKVERTSILILQLAKFTKDRTYYDFALKRAQDNIPGFVAGQ